MRYNNESTSFAMVFEIVANPKMDNPMKGIEIKIAMIENTINEITEHFEGFRPNIMPSAPHITKEIADHIPMPRYEIPLYSKVLQLWLTQHQKDRL